MVDYVSVVPGPSIRAGRAALFAVVCVGVGAAMHGLAGGCAVHPQSIAVGLVAVAALAYAGLGRERRGPELTLGLGAAELGLHYLFGAVDAAPSAMGMNHPMPDASAAMAMPTPVAAHPDTLGMLLAHTIAVLISGWWLRCGERDFFGLCRAATALAAAPLRRLLTVAAMLASGAPAPAAGPRKRPARRNPDPRPAGLPLLTSVTFRGPPAAA
jgi:hypothetical protein